MDVFNFTVNQYNFAVNAFTQCAVTMPRSDQHTGWRQFPESRHCVYIRVAETTHSIQKEEFVCLGSKVGNA
jgi:hypothetical protein